MAQWRAGPKDGMGRRDSITRTKAKQVIGIQQENGKEGQTGHPERPNL